MSAVRPIKPSNSPVNRSSEPLTGCRSWNDWDIKQVWTVDDAQNARFYDAVIIGFRGRQLNRHNSVFHIYRQLLYR